ncbi:hypothetical protein SKUN_00622 [Spiroplasma kunkelii CR2-3x]|uniref:Uncharacterized protein n=1 Tax=Spiroplasma kunkelii CR2-3x TaxID=273035 RepID=A0A0K2JFZ1_SPIKU|nr:hypothetical protein [Spiroplasma kunkelii]ALA97515.1 hypothetical protein SKUN_00622 [Spiroplasma kunkelii CR2-3x]
MGKVVRYFDNNFPGAFVAIGKPKNKNTNFEVKQWKHCYGLINTCASTKIMSKK